VLYQPEGERFSRRRCPEINYHYEKNYIIGYQGPIQPFNSEYQRSYVYDKEKAKNYFEGNSIFGGVRRSSYPDIIKTGQPNRKKCIKLIKCDSNGPSPCVINHKGKTDETNRRKNILNIDWERIYEEKNKFDQDVAETYIRNDNLINRNKSHVNNGQNLKTVDVFLTIENLNSLDLVRSRQ